MASRFEILLHLVFTELELIDIGVSRKRQSGHTFKVKAVGHYQQYPKEFWKLASH